MLTEPLIQQLTQLRLHGMAQALERQIAAPDPTPLSFKYRLGPMSQAEVPQRGRGNGRARTRGSSCRRRWGR